MTTETTNANEATETIVSLMGRRTPAERSAGRFLRSPDGHPEQAPVAAAEPTAEPVQVSDPAPEPAPPAASVAVRPDGLDDKFWDDASGLKVGDLVSHLRDLETKAAERTAGVPGEGEAYDLSLPDGFEKPDGIEIEFKADDPLWAKFQEIGKSGGVDKTTFGQFVGAFAEYQIAQHQADIDTFVAEKTALGANADTRIKAAETYLKANLTTKQAEALGGALISKDGVEALEALIRLKSGPRAVENAGATSASEFEGLHGADRLAAIRAKQAAA